MFSHTTIIKAQERWMLGLAPSFQETRVNYMIEKERLIEQPKENNTEE